MTMSMNVLCKLKSGPFAWGEQEPWSCSLDSAFVALVVGGIWGAGLLLSGLTNDESRRALVLLANTPKSIKVDVRERRTSHTLTVQTFSRKEILCRACESSKNKDGSLTTVKHYIPTQASLESVREMALPTLHF